LWPEPSARRAYPLYFALATPFTAALSAANPARGLNLFSAVWAGVAVGLLTFLVARLTRFTLAGVAAGLLLAFSHTFWTQAIIAEVYSLHLALVGVCLLALYAWYESPTVPRLALFFAVYALAFGNHLSTILLFVPCVVFLFHVHPRPRDLLRPSIIGLALVIAAAGALQYAQNFMFVWTSIEAPPSWSARIAAFWMDATKSDWRGSMVLGVDPSQLRDRLAMWWWDSRQQFGAAGLTLAAFGAVRLWMLSRPWALFTCLAYVISTAFALSYNVGDTHVFLLPGHFFTALAAGVALTPGRRRLSDDGAAALSLRARFPYSVLALLAIAYAGWRGWETWPAVDRHTDRRADAYLSHLTEDIDERSALLISRLDWQLENIVLYSGRYERPGLAWVRLDDVLPHFPFLVRDNLMEDRDIVLTADAASEVRSTYGDIFPIVQDQPSSPTIASLADQVPRGAPYVMTSLSPAPGPASVDEKARASAIQTLARGTEPPRSGVGYEVWAGLAGEKPLFHRWSAHPFIDRFAVAGDDYTVRMDAWLPQDTFRRGGFGHVLRGREHALWIERGISLLWLSQSGTPTQAYAAGLYSPEARFRIVAPSAHLARITTGAVQ